MRTSNKWVLAILLAFGLTGCPLLLKERSSEITGSGKTLGPPPDDLKPTLRVRRAYQDLQIGKQETARQQLRWALMTDPNHRMARGLLDQLDADPIKRLGKERFSYTIQAGDTLSHIAKMFLADPLKFVILGRYNNIQNPSKISIGQTIQIPGKRRTVETVSTTRDQTGKTNKQKTQPQVDEQVGTKPTLAPEPQRSVKQSEDIQAKQYKRAKELFAAGNIQEVIPLLETAMEANRASAGLRELLIDSYSIHADQLMEEKKLASARTLLENAIILDPSNDHLIARLTIIEDEIEADRLFILASKQADEGRLEEAYQTYSQLLLFSPDHVLARQAQSRVRINLAEQYHRQGMQLFRRHKLDEAIVYWDKVIEIDPDHNLAQDYRARAFNLKRQLKRLQNR